MREAALSELGSAPRLDVSEDLRPGSTDGTRDCLISIG